MRYTYSKGYVGWFTAFVFPRNYSIISFTITIQRTQNSGTPLHTIIDVLCPSSIDAGRTVYTIRQRSASFAQTHIQACKIRIVRYEADSDNMHVEVYLGRPDGETSTVDDNNNFYITLSDIISAGNQIYVYNNITTYTADNPSIVPDEPTGVYSLAAYDLVYSLSLSENIPMDYKYYDYISGLDYDSTPSGSKKATVITMYVSSTAKSLKIMPVFNNSYGDFSILVSGRYAIYTATAFITKEIVSDNLYLNFLNTNHRPDYDLENLYKIRRSEDKLYFELSFPTWDKVTCIINSNMGYRANLITWVPDPEPEGE